MTLRRFLATLATDFHRLAEFYADPKAAAKQAGLSKDDRAALFSGDQNVLYSRLTAAEEDPTHV
jgi:hypothetical protein